MKYKDRNYLQLSREIFKSQEFLDLSLAAKWLYFVLCELEHRFIGKEDFFFRSNEDLAKDANLAGTTLKRAKKELRKTGLVEMFQIEKMSNITGFRLK